MMLSSTLPSACSLDKVNAATQRRMYVVSKQLFFEKVLVVCNIFIIFATYYYKVHAYDARRT